MRAPLSWIDEFTPLEGATPEGVHAALVSVGLEEEDLHRFELSGPIVVGQVLEFVEEPQKNGKTIRWCQVQVAPEGETAADGGPAVHGVVCGAGNFFAGDKVVVTLPGAVLPGPFPIAARKTYGHLSDGMIASVRELGLGDEHDGILRLASLGLDPEVGSDAIALLGLDDAAVEVNVTPDRGYAFSIRGIAREYSHATGRAFADPAGRVPAYEAEGFRVEIADERPIRGNIGAPGFVTRVVRGVDAARPTPPWMTARLKLAGVRSISLLVDITNYVMFELGQPIHGYDLDKLAGGITVRRANPGETLETLDGVTRTLDPEDLLITDDSGPIGLAGVMGGGPTELSGETRNVLIEAATFDPVSIARTARRHKLPSEASKRFERGVDPHVAIAAANRVAELMVELAGGTVDALGSTLVTAARPEPILLPAGFAERVVGIAYTPEEERNALEMIGAQVADAAGALSVTPPSWRSDLTDKWTLVEEIARIVGYDRIPSELPVAPPQRGLTRAQRLRRGTSNALAASGFVETISYPFFTEAVNARFGSPDGSPIGQVKLANALDAQAAWLRTSLLPGLIEVARRNRSRGFTDLAIFETGLVFRPEAGREYGTATVPPAAVRPSDETIAELEASIPPQPRRIGVLLTGERTPKQPGIAAVPAGIADALEAVRTIGRAVGAEIEIVQGGHRAMHPGRTAELRVADVPVGFAGELLPELAEEADLPRVVAVAELDLDRVIELAARTIEAAALSTYPAATQDLSMLVDETVPAADVAEAVRTGAGPLLEELRLVDVYRGAGIPEGKKSVLFALRFRAADRTLTAAEASEAKIAGATLAETLTGATIRD
ncbi:phenylalanine--tRNA ligase subunit beta [Agromyces archimandritae]|uniref:Phenylalanine--tRNA ligase beta subunit n=1 Tax=Agromyces archimandritae TaxID=2781962 RepID=A0A975FNN2_9MICO|nr:phenylalanine--tRNA ligase subunit beta [Agromyces archimandritae]QTX04997.1 phenylalanine--tRNA ligase subunit beta [Agromyces archimandritae]